MYLFHLDYVANNLNIILFYIQNSRKKTHFAHIQQIRVHHRSINIICRKRIILFYVVRKLLYSFK